MNRRSAAHKELAILKTLNPGLAVELEQVIKKATAFRSTDLQASTVWPTTPHITFWIGRAAGTGSGFEVLTVEMFVEKSGKRPFLALLSHRR